MKLDPGSRTTGIALVAEFPVQSHRIIWAGELTHRSQQTTKRLADRRAHRRVRRNRRCRNRPARFDNRRRSEGWLPPSIQARVDQTATWAKRLAARCPVSAIDVETTRFDVHALSTGKPLSGVEYQQGTLHGTEVREYLLHRHGHQCAYCAGLTGDPILEIEHVQPRGRSGSNRVANLVVACHTCNTAKGNRSAGEWAATLGKSKLDQRRRANADRIEAGKRPSLRDAAAVNASRYAIGGEMKSFGVPVTFASGGRTKYNRASQGYPKAHWIDAACVGTSGEAVRLDPLAPVLAIRAAGRGQRQVCKMDRFGFPRARAGRCKRVQGFQTGDVVRLNQRRGKYRGVHVGPLAGVRRDGRMDVRTTRGTITAMARNLTRLARFDGYTYDEGRLA